MPCFGINKINDKSFYDDFKTQLGIVSFLPVIIEYLLMDLIHLRVRTYFGRLIYLGLSSKGK